ncbi:NAD-dependent epimerase/dehydratase family protein [Umezawaea sp.]|uniref:NAD-dependent epimerase/dehydratase family protein n=1 Tax=Umezawaea sp. TaxID=1955258 RepID=UPI002ED4FAAF
MTVVVTGASGSIGTALLERLGGDVVGVARRVPDETAPPYARARWVRCDLAAPTADALLREVFAGARAVVHLAWAVQPDRHDRPMRDTNLDGTARVLRAVADAGVPQVVCASSVAAYAPGPRTRRVGEAWPVTGVPGSAYSAQKAALESVLDAFTAEHPTIAVARIRPCGVLQPASAAQLRRWTLGPLLPARLLGRRLLPVPLWHGLRAQAVHADDVAAAITALLDRGLAGAFNLAAEPVLDARDLARILGGGLLPVPLPVLRALTWAAWRTGLVPLHPGWLRLADQAPVVDTARAAELLGWRPEHDTRAVLRQFVAALAHDGSAPSAPLRGGAGRLGPLEPTHQSQGREAR